MQLHMCSYANSNTIDIVNNPPIFKIVNPGQQADVLAAAIVQTVENYVQLEAQAASRANLLNSFISSGYSFLEYYIVLLNSQCPDMRPPVSTSVDSADALGLHSLYTLLSTDTVYFSRSLANAWPFVFFPAICTTTSTSICTVFLNNDAFCAALQGGKTLEMRYCFMREPGDEALQLMESYNIAIRSLSSITAFDIVFHELMQGVVVRQIVTILCRDSRQYTDDFLKWLQTLLNMSTCCGSDSFRHQVSLTHGLALEQLLFLAQEKYVFHSTLYPIRQIIRAIQRTSLTFLLENRSFYHTADASIVEASLLFAELLKLVLNKFTGIRRKVSGEHVPAHDMSADNIMEATTYDNSLFSGISTTVYATALMPLSSKAAHIDAADLASRLLLLHTLAEYTNLSSYLLNPALIDERPSGAWTYPAVILAHIHNNCEFAANYRTFLTAAQSADLDLNSIFATRLAAWSALSPDGYSKIASRVPVLPLYSHLLSAFTVRHMAEDPSRQNSLWTAACVLRARLLQQGDCLHKYAIGELTLNQKLATDDVFDVVFSQAQSLLPVPEWCEKALSYCDMQAERLLSVVFLAAAMQCLGVSFVYKIASGLYARNGEAVIGIALGFLSCYNPVQFIMWNRYIFTLRTLIAVLCVTSHSGSVYNPTSTLLTVLQSPADCCMLAILASFGLISRGMNELFVQSADSINKSYLPLLCVVFDRRRLMVQHITLIDSSAGDTAQSEDMPALHPETPDNLALLHRGALLLLLQLIFLTQIPYPCSDRQYIQGIIAAYVTLNPHKSPSALILELAKEFPGVTDIVELTQKICGEESQRVKPRTKIQLTAYGWEVLEPLLVPLELDQVHTAFADCSLAQELRIIPALVNPRCNVELLDALLNSRHFGAFIISCSSLYVMGKLKHCYLLHLLRLMYCILMRIEAVHSEHICGEVCTWMSKSYTIISQSASNLLFDPMAKIIVERIEKALTVLGVQFKPILQAAHAAHAAHASIADTMLNKHSKRTKQARRKPVQFIKQKMAETLNQLMTDYHMEHDTVLGSADTGVSSTTSGLCCVCLEPLSSNAFLVHKMQLSAFSQLDMHVFNELQAAPLQVIRSSFLHLAFQKYIKKLGGESTRYPPRVWPELSIFSLEARGENSGPILSHHSTGHLYLPDIMPGSLLMPYVEQSPCEQYPNIILWFFTAPSTELFSLLSVSCPHLQHISCMLKIGGATDSFEQASLTCPVCSLQYITGIPVFRNILLQPSCFWSAKNYKMHCFILIKLVFPLLLRILYTVSPKPEIEGDPEKSATGTLLNHSALETVLSSDPFLLGMSLFLVHIIDSNFISLILLLRCDEVAKDGQLLQLFAGVITNMSRIFCVILYLIRHIQAFDVALGNKPFLQTIEECLAYLGGRAVLSVQIIWSVLVGLDRLLQQHSEAGTEPHMADVTRVIVAVIQSLTNSLVRNANAHTNIEDTAISYDLLLMCVEAMVYEAICTKEFSPAHATQLRGNLDSFFKGGCPMALTTDVQLEMHTFQTHVARISTRNQTQFLTRRPGSTTFELLCPLAHAETAFRRLQLAHATLGRNAEYLRPNRNKVCIYCGLPVDDRRESFFADDILVDRATCNCWGHDFFESPFFGERYVMENTKRHVIEPYEDAFGFPAATGSCFVAFQQRYLSNQMLTLIYSGLLGNSKETK